VFFDGPLPRRQIGAAIRAATASGGLCCFPSRWENYPNVCLEAMALGAPVLGSDAGGMSEIIEHQTSGLLFRSGDAEDLAAKLTRLLQDADLRNRMSAAAPGRIQSACDPHLVVDSIMDVIARARDSSAADHSAALRIVTMSTDEFGVAPEPDADWLILLEPGVTKDPRVDQFIADAIARSPGTNCLAALSARGEVILAPSGFDRDLLSIYDCASYGFLAIRKPLIHPYHHSRDAHGGSLWFITAMLALSDQQCTLIPEPLTSTTTPPRPQDDLRARLASELPLLAESPGRALRLFDSLRRSELQQLQNRVASAAAEAAALKTHLASRRYRLADRINNALKTLRLRPR
jgi:hypothetical protein